MSRHLQRAQQVARRLDAMRPRETRRQRLVREAAERIVAEHTVGDLQAAIAAHRDFDGDDCELLLDVLLHARRLLHPVPDFMGGQAGEPTPLDAEIAEAIAATRDPRRVWL